MARVKSERGHNPDAVKANILEVATRIFAEKGYSGARVDEIADETLTAKAMIYYYYKDKEGLYFAVLEHAYAAIRKKEAALNLDVKPPMEALQILIEFTFDYHFSHPEFVRLIMIENIHQGSHIQKSPLISTTNTSIIAAMEKLFERGKAQGVFRKDLNALQVHMTISALCFYYVSNRFTFAAIFKNDMVSEAAALQRREAIVQLILKDAKL